MTTITLKQAYDLIANCTAIKVDNDWLCCPVLDILTGDPENQWLYVACELFCTKFIEEDQPIFLDGSTITMQDYEDEITTLLLLTPMPINL